MLYLTGEINPETYAIAKADLLLKGDGDQSEHIHFGSTLSDDGWATYRYDFMLSNPPYGKTWKTDAEKMGGKTYIANALGVTAGRNFYTVRYVRLQDLLAELSIARAFPRKPDTIYVPAAALSNPASPGVKRRRHIHSAMHGVDYIK